MGALDATVLRELAVATGGGAWLTDLLKKYVTKTRELLDALGGFVEVGDSKGAAALAHSAKSSSRTVGATQLGTLLEQLERADDPAAMQTLYTQVLEEFAQVELAAQRFSGG